MAYSEYQTELSLDRWAALAGVHFLHFNQLRTPAAFAGLREVGCDNIIFQHRYQSSSGVPGRNDIARAIFEAERDLEDYLRFSLMKQWVDQEDLLRHRAFESRSWRGPVKVAKSYVIGPAVRTSTLIESGASVATEDRDNDGFEETVVVTVTVDSTTFAAAEAEEFRVFYPDKGDDPLWEIRPATVVMDANTLEVAISFNISQLVDPALYEQMVPDALDPDDPSTFLDSVDIYRVYSDTTLANAFKASYVSPTSVLPVAVDTSRFLVRVFDAVGGIFEVGMLWPWWPGLGLGSFPGTVGFWSPTETLSYAAGFPRSTFTVMAPQFERAVLALSLSRLGGICSCPNIPDFSRDLSIIGKVHSSGGNLEHTLWARKPPDDVMNNPFGTSLGENIAWQAIQREIIGEPANDYIDTGHIHRRPLL